MKGGRRVDDLTEIYEQYAEQVFKNKALTFSRKNGDGSLALFSFRSSGTVPVLLLCTKR